MTANPQVGTVVDDEHRAELPVRLSDLYPDVLDRLEIVDEAVGLAMLVRDLDHGDDGALFALKDCARILLAKTEA